MAKIQTACPNCQQPLVADIHQVIDINQNPGLKDLLLAGGLNLALCQVCGFQGQLPVPLVYHDGSKELLLTFSPPGMDKTMEEKESALAPLLRQVIDNLEPDQRKGYLFQPQAMLTMNNLVKNVLQADGITEEMLEEQQEKLRLLDQLFSQQGEQLITTLRENDQSIDREFFSIFAEIAQRIIASQDENSVQRVKEVQDALMEETTVGREIKIEADNLQEATRSLEALGKNLTRSSLLELVLAAPGPGRVRALASLARPAMDYQFFQEFTERIEATADDERKDLVEKRNLLLKITQEMDQQVEARINAARQAVTELIQEENLEQAIAARAGQIDQFFIQALSMEIETAEKESDTNRLEKLQQLLKIIQDLSTPPEVQMLDELAQAAGDEAELERALKEISPEQKARMLEYLTSILGNYESGAEAASEEEQEQLESTLDDLRDLYGRLLKESMQEKMES